MLHGEQPLVTNGVYVTIIKRLYFTKCIILWYLILLLNFSG